MTSPDDFPDLSKAKPCAPQKVPASAKMMVIFYGVFLFCYYMATQTCFLSDVFYGAGLLFGALPSAIAAVLTLSKKPVMLIYASLIISTAYICANLCLLYFGPVTCGYPG
jgi:hypothetical protein